MTRERVIDDLEETAVQLQNIVDDIRKGKGDELEHLANADAMMSNSSLYIARYLRIANGPKAKWFKKVKEEQEHYPSLKGKELNPDHLEALYKENFSPIDALNALITAV